MGSISASKNWPGYTSEAKRCHATNGYLLIAETTKSVSASGRLSRLRNVIKENGFEIYNDEQRGDFTFIEGRELQCIQAVRLMIRTE